MNRYVLSSIGVSERVTTATYDGRHRGDGALPDPCATKLERHADAAMCQRRLGRGRAEVRCCCLEPAQVAMRAAIARRRTPRRITDESDRGLAIFLPKGGQIHVMTHIPLLPKNPDRVCWGCDGALPRRTNLPAETAPFARCTRWSCSATTGYSGSSGRTANQRGSRRRRGIPRVVRNSSRPPARTPASNLRWRNVGAPARPHHQIREETNVDHD